MAKNKNFTYNIRQVIELTGVSEFTLRGWENRYQAFSPYRTETGRRLYSKEDVLRIKALQALLVEGEKISQVAKLDLKKLLELIEKNRVAQIEPSQKKDKVHFDQINQILIDADRFDWDQVEKSIDRLSKKMTGKKFIYEFLLNLIGEINSRVMQNKMNIAQEHILSSMIKESLFSLKSQQKNRDKSKIRLVMATPEGDFHEIGILIASTLASLSGVQTLYLGPNVPKADLCETCIRFKATHLLLSCTITPTEGTKEDIFKLIHFLDRHLDSKISLFIAGKAAANSDFKLERNFAVLHNFKDFEEAITKKTKSERTEKLKMK